MAERPSYLLVKDIITHNIPSQRIRGQSKWVADIVFSTYECTSVSSIQFCYINLFYSPMNIEILCINNEPMYTCLHMYIPVYTLLDWIITIFINYWTLKTFSSGLFDFRNKSLDNKSSTLWIWLSTLPVVPLIHLFKISESMFNFIYENNDISTRVS